MSWPGTPAQRQKQIDIIERCFGRCINTLLIRLAIVDYIFRPRGYVIIMIWLDMHRRKQTTSFARNNSRAWVSWLWVFTTSRAKCSSRLIRTKVAGTSTDNCSITWWHAGVEPTPEHLSTYWYCGRVDLNVQGSTKTRPHARILIPFREHIDCNNRKPDKNSNVYIEKPH